MEDVKPSSTSVPEPVPTQFSQSAAGTVHTLIDLPGIKPYISLDLLKSIGEHLLDIVEEPFELDLANVQILPSKDDPKLVFVPVTDHEIEEDIKAKLEATVGILLTNEPLTIGAAMTRPDVFRIQVNETGQAPGDSGEPDVTLKLVSLFQKDVEVPLQIASIGPDPAHDDPQTGQSTFCMRVYNFIKREWELVCVNWERQG